MSKFLFVYRAPKNYAPSEDPTAAWNAWFGSMGDSVADFGDQVYVRSTIGNSGPDTELAGYSAVTADDLESAVAMANGCPGLKEGFGVEVGLLGQPS